MRLADLFAAHWVSYRHTHAQSLCRAHHRAAEALMTCRTPAQGGRYYACADCGAVHGRYYSCHHRSCPQCGGSEQQRWAATQEAKLLPCDYFLLTFTLPQGLRRLVYREQQALFKLFFDAVAQTMRDMAADPQWLGGEIGFLCVLHTWTRRLLYHPHIHILMPGMALDPKHHRILRPVKSPYLVPGNVIAAMLRNRFEILLKTRHPHWHNQLPTMLWRQSWVADVENVGRGKEALRYLSAYVAKSAITDARILGEDHQGRALVRWFDRHHHNAPRTMALPPHELIRRVLLHVLPKGLRRIRYYGWLSPAANKRFSRVCLLCGLARLPHLPEIPTNDPLCEHCGSERLILIGSFPKARPPPQATTRPILMP